MAKFSTIEELPAGLMTADFVFRNQEPIAQRLAQWLPADRCQVLEIASGWGQHACYWSWRLPELGLGECHWQPTECPERLHDLHDWSRYANRDVLQHAIEYQVGQTMDHGQASDDDPLKALLNTQWNAILAANFCHYVNHNTVIALFTEANQLLVNGGHLYIYGPINKAGAYTSEGNQQLDLWLKQRQADTGIKDIDDLIQYGRQWGFQLMANQAMPANNHWLVFQKVTSESR